MHEHPCRTTFPIGTSDSDSDKVFADLGDHLVVGDTDMEVFLGRCLLMVGMLCLGQMHQTLLQVT